MCGGGGGRGNGGGGEIGGVLKEKNAKQNLRGRRYKNKHEYCKVDPQ